MVPKAVNGVWRVTAVYATSLNVAVPFAPLALTGHALQGWCNLM
jgi:hypothetical protein